MEPIKPLVYQVDYFVGPDPIAHKEATQLLPRQGDKIMFPKDDDTYTSTVFTVEDVCIVIPDVEGDIVPVAISLEEY